jgi:hypothetical protein
MSDANGRPPVSNEAQDRKAQSELEYWKAQYDFHKHLMTLGLAAAAGFVAVLALPGFFGIRDLEAKVQNRQRPHVKETRG